MNGRAWPPPSTPQQPESGRFVWTAPKAVGLALAVCAGVGLLAIAERSTTDGKTTRAEQPADCVRYYVEGSARSVSLTLRNSSGDTEQADQRTLPLRTQTGDGLGAGCHDGERFFAYISAQNEGQTGSVTCRIERDGREVARATSSGAYVIATCSD